MYEAAGPLGDSEAKNAVHGVWLGHPLHPVFTDVPIGAWTTALALDAAADAGGARDPAAPQHSPWGSASSVPWARRCWGLTDWSETGGQSRLQRAGATVC